MATDNTGSTNSPYDAVTIETIAGEIQAAPLNTSLGNLDTAVQSHSHPLDSAVGRDSMKSSFRPPDTGDSTNRWRVVCGTKSVTITGGSNASALKTVTFATDDEQGDPSFSAVPIFVATSQGGGAEGFVCVTRTITATAATFQLFELDGGTAGSGTVYVNWIAYGKVA